MTAVCQSCHKMNPGAYYDLFTGGRVTDAAPGSHLLYYKVTGESVGDILHERVFICDQCAAKAKRNKGGQLFLAVLLLLGFGGAGMLSLLEWIDGKRLGFMGSVGTIIALLLIPVFLVWMFTLIRDLLQKGIPYSNGESVALLATQVSAAGVGRFVWSPKDFKSTFGIGTAEGSTSIMDEITVVNRDQ